MIYLMDSDDLTSSVNYKAYAGKLYKNVCFLVG